MVQIPYFPECDRPLIQSLSNHSDDELVAAFQRHREQGKFFTAIFCRYSSLVYALIAQTIESPEMESPEMESPEQVNVLFTQTWHEIYKQLPQLTPRDDPDHTSNFLANWLSNQTNQYLRTVNVSAAESITTDVMTASPPLRCYLEQALDHLPLILRFTVVMKNYFGWSQSRIAAFLQAEGENLSAEQVQETLHKGHQALAAALPSDIYSLYLVPTDEMSS